MGVHIGLTVARHVRWEKWRAVYEEVFSLADQLHLGSRQSVMIRGKKVTCISPIREEDLNGRCGFWVDADYDLGFGAEGFFFPRELSEPKEGDSGGDVLLEHAWEIDQIEEPTARVETQNIWGDKTQGEPYHLSLLSLGCLVEDRLGADALVHGDITAGQCRVAVKRANKVLSSPIQVPCRCDTDRWMERISSLSASEEEKMSIALGSYLSRKDVSFGDALRRVFPQEVWQSYWKEKFRECSIGTLGFSWELKDYLSLGFDLRELCHLVTFGEQKTYERFIELLLDAKLHWEEKDCEDMLDKDPEDPHLVGIDQFIAGFMFAGARNPKVDRFIPIEEIRAILREELGGVCDTERMVDEYVKEETRKKKEGEKEDASAAFSAMMKETAEKLEDGADIVSFDGLLFYQEGDTLAPSIEANLINLMEAGEKFLKENTVQKALRFDIEKQKDILAGSNNTIRGLRDKDWEKIFQEMEEDKNAFAKYLSLLCISQDRREVSCMVAAVIRNDALYAYARSLAEKKKGENP